MRGLNYIIEAQTAADRRGVTWEAIAAFDSEPVARRYADACGATGAAELYRVRTRPGLAWVTIHTTGRLASTVDAATARNHPAPIGTTRAVQVSA